MNTAVEPFRRHRLSVADYHRMGEAGILAPDTRVELIEGEIVDMTPIGSIHASVIKRLGRLLNRAAGDRVIVAVQDPLILGDDSEPEPDVALLRFRDDFYARAHPGAEDALLVIEVADTTLVYDRDVKLPLYARHGIPEVWLVDVRGRRLTVHRDAAPEGYRDERTARTLKGLLSACCPELRLDLSGLFG